MSSPTSREPEERPDATNPGQHSAPRPDPPAAGASDAAPPRGPSGTPPGATSGGTSGAPPASGGHVADRPVDAAPRADAPRSQDGPAGHGAVAPGPPDSGPAVADRARPLPERPRKPGFGRHTLGVLLGLVVTPVALLLAGIGAARLSDVAVSSRSPLTDALGLTLLLVGAILLAVIALFALWSPAVPIVGGLVWGVGLGLAFLTVPDTMTDTLEAMSGDSVVPGGAEQLVESAMSGHLLVTGTLLVAGGIAAGQARRRGRRWAEEVAAADTARAEARTGPTAVDRSTG